MQGIVTTGLKAISKEVFQRGTRKLEERANKGIERNADSLNKKYVKEIFAISAFCCHSFKTYGKHHLKQNMTIKMTSYCSQFSYFSPYFINIKLDK